MLVGRFAGLMRYAWFCQQFDSGNLAEIRGVGMSRSRYPQPCAASPPLWTDLGMEAQKM